jgi:uncharacterized membrane protein
MATYTYTTIAPPESSYTISVGPNSINAKGEIVGEYEDNSGGHTTHGFLESHGAYTTIDPPGSTETIAFGINAKGQIIGQYDRRSAERRRI